MRPFSRKLTLCLRLALAIGFLAGSARSETNESASVHVVAIGDLDVGGNFGKKVVEDARNIIGTFEQAFAGAGRSRQLKTHLLVGQDVTPKHVLEVIAKLPIQANDTLVVLYSGHGQMEADKKHVLTFHHGSLLRENLLAAMKAKNPRLMVLLTDCCSGGILARAEVPQYEPKDLKVADRAEWSTIHSLFFCHSGLVDLSAAEPGFCGKLDRKKSGSLFTNALIRVLKTPYGELVRNLDSDGDGHMQWDEILPQLRGLAAQYHEQQYEDAAQQAYANLLGRWQPAGR